MKGKKNLERAIVLGLILSTGVYGSAWAAEVTTGEFIKGQYTDGRPVDGITIDGNTINVSDSITVNGTGTVNDIQWEPGKTISVGTGIDLTLNKVWLQNATITGNGNVIINSTNGTPVWINANIEANKLILDTKTGNGITTYDGNVNLKVNELK